MSKRDYYEVLGVTRTSTEVELKAAFRKLAMQHHPDRNPGDKEAEAKFKEAAEAYDVLGDEEKKKRYDQFGEYREDSKEARTAGRLREVLTTFRTPALMSTA